MEFGLLGPLAVRCGGVDVPVPRGKQRALLSVLLLNSGRVVPVSVLAETLWGPAPPPSADASIRNYVKRLRQVLGGTGRERIRTRPPGYLIRVTRDELDVFRFEALTETARAAARKGAWPEAARQAGAALALWRGEPLADAESDALALREVPRLAELRVQAVEMRLEADLHLGRHAEVIAELERIIAAHPMREHLHSLLMLALYRDGRQAEALAAYQRARGALVTELGVEPGAELRELHRRVLACDVGLAVPAPDPAGAESRRDTLRQLPAAVADFAGRIVELETLTRILDRADAGTPGTVVISAIGGSAGVGKSALMLHWAHRVAGRFGDGQLYVNLRGFDSSGTPATPAEVVRGFLDALGVPPERIPPCADAQAALYRGVLADKEMLIVLDNARDEQQVRPLLPASPASLVIVTSRNRLAGLAAHRAWLLSLVVLAHDEAVQLLTARIGEGRASAEPGAVDEIAALCAHLPLALAVTAARAAVRSRFPLAALAAELRDSAGRLDVLDAGDPAVSVRAAFSWSYQQLSPEAARMFRLLGLHPGHDISVPAAASLAGCQVPQARRLLGELTRGCLITEIVPGRLAFHDLLRAYAAEQAAASDSEQARRAAVHRMLDHYLHTAYAAALLLRPDREPLALPPPQPGVTVKPVTGDIDILAWFQAEHRLLLAAVALAAGARYDAHAWRLAWALGPFLYRCGYWQEWNTALASALTAAERLGDLTGQAHTCRSLGNTAAVRGLHQDAHGYLRKALDLFGQLGDRANQAHVHLHFGYVLGQQNRYDDALTHHRQSLDLFQAIGHRTGEAAALNSLGWCLAHLGNCEQAITWCRQALGLCRETSFPQSEANTWNSLGYAHHRLGHHAEAIDCYQRALSLYSEVGSRYYQTEALTHLGDAHHAAGNLHAARDAWQQAVAILDDLHHPDAERVTARLSELDASTSPLSKT